MERILNAVKRTKRAAAVLGAVVIAGAVTLPAGESQVAYAANTNSDKPTTITLNSADCFPLAVNITGGPIRAAMAMTAHRNYTLYEGGSPVRDITKELQEKPGATTYNDFDWDGNKVGTVSEVAPYFSDYGVSLENGEQSQIFRARYERNSQDTQAYRLERVNGTYENTGDYLVFSKDTPDGLTEINNLCGQTEVREAIKVKKWRILKDGIRRVKNDILMLVRDCIVHDGMESEHYLRTPEKPATPIKEEPKPETPGRTPMPPVPVPVQLPRGGDGSTSTESNPNIPRWPGH